MKLLIIGSGGREHANARAAHQRRSKFCNRQSLLCILVLTLMTGAAFCFGCKPKAPNQIIFGLKKDDQVCIGSFSGSFNDELRLRTEMGHYGIIPGFDGSKVYDIYVPANKENLARQILLTNELTLKGKISLRP